MQLTFYGAAENVTGSKHLVESEGFRILLDCGLYQGTRNASGKTLPFDAKSIDCVILSHAHADHCGMLPVLVKNGFRGKIYCTTATADIAKFILLDSAMVQAMDARYAELHPRTGPAPEVMYTKQEAENVFQYFETVPYFRLTKQWTQLNDKIRFKFYDAGHILGSAITFLEANEQGKTKGLVFTGDLGQMGAPILHDPEFVSEKAQTIISEATYGGTIHEPISNATILLKEAIEHALKHKSKIIVPAFALGRTQELIYVIHNLIDRNEIPRIPIYIDSPLGLNITDVFAKHMEDFDDQTKTDFGNRNELPLIFRNLKYIHTVEESKALNHIPGPFMIISSSGMMEGGRIMHHLRNNLEDRNNTVLITGYQAQSTLGRRLQDGATTVNIFNQPLRVRARIITMNEFSAHADQKFLTTYIKSISDLENVFLVHTELPQAQALKDILETNQPKYKIHIPKPSEIFEV